MTPAAQSRIRAAFATLADEVIAALGEEAAPGAEPDRMYSIAEARERLGGVSRSTVYALIERGELRSTRVGGRRLVSSSAIAELAQRGEAA